MAQTAKSGRGESAKAGHRRLQPRANREARDAYEAARRIQRRPEKGSFLHGGESAAAGRPSGDSANVSGKHGACRSARKERARRGAA